jgi:hypothetical protein
MQDSNSRKARESAENFRIGRARTDDLRSEVAEMEGKQAVKEQYGWAPRPTF